MRLSWLIVPVLVLGLACSGLGREGGVTLPNQLDEIARGYIQEHGLLLPGEEVRAFYDATIALDGSEILLVTDRRIVHYLDGNTTAVSLHDVVSIERVEDIPLTDAWVVTTRDGISMQLEVAVLNGGEIWDRVLMQSWRSANAP